MNSHIILFGIVLCIIAVNARHFNEQSESSADEQVKRERDNGVDRHRRKRYHINYGYDYQQPANPFYPSYNNRRDQQDLLPEIHRLLDEISSYLRRPPAPAPPPQPIYIPYAVPYPVCNCPASQPPLQAQQPDVNITNRFPDMDDTNQNWGILDDGGPEEEGDGTRPLSFAPIKPKQPMRRPAIALEHGTQSQSARVPSTTRAPAVIPHVPAMCDVFSLSCCTGSPTEQKRCLINSGCPDTYDNGKGCDQERLLKIIDEYSRAYAP